MVFEPNFTKVASSVRKNLGIAQSVIELKLPTNEELIEKVYSISTRSTINSNEMSGREIDFVGSIDFQAVYESQGVSSIDYTADFRDKFVANEELYGEIILTSNVIDVTSSVVAKGIRVTAIVETVIDIIETRDLNLLTGVSGDNVCVSNKDIEIETYLGRAYEKFDLTHEFQIKDSEKILIVTPCVSLKNVEPRENFLSVSGVVNIDVCYQSSNSKMKSVTDCVDFCYEVALSGIDSESSVHSLIEIVTGEIKVSTMMDENGANINMYLPLSYSGYVFNKNRVKIIDDVYSQSNFLAITSECFESNDSFGSFNFKENISGSASIAETSPFIDEMLGVCTNNIVLASSRVINNKLHIEGVANVTVAYYTKEIDSITSVQIEMLFMIEEKVSGEFANVVTLCVDNLTSRSKRGKEVEVSADLCVFVDTYKKENVCAITQVSLGETKVMDDCSLYIYIVKSGDSLWSIAKDMNVTVDSIIEQNPGVTENLNIGDKLIIYKSQVFDF